MSDVDLDLDFDLSEARRLCRVFGLVHLDTVNIDGETVILFSEANSCRTLRLPLRDFTSSKIVETLELDNMRDAIKRGVEAHMTAWKAWQK